MRVFLLSLALLALAACGQNSVEVRNGEILEESPRPVVDPTAKPLAMAVPRAPAGGAGGGPMTQGFAKAYFMHKFVAALYSVPANSNPNPRWSSPLKDSESGRVWCTDCHFSTTVDFTKIPFDRTPENDALEKDHGFMVDLMEKWVARLNSDGFKAKAKLKQPVNCLTCHASDPRDQ